MVLDSSGADADGDSQGFFRENVGNVLSPFHDAEESAVDVVVETYVEGFGNLFDPVEIEVVHRLPGACPVLVDDCEGWRTDCVFLNPEAAADGSGEGCFSGTHRCMECDEFVPPDFLKELFGCGIDFLQASYYDLVSHFELWSQPDFRVLWSTF